MGKRNKERRAASRRRRQRANRGPSGEHRTDRRDGRRDGPPPTPEDLLQAAVWYWGGDAGRERVIQALVDHGEAGVDAVTRHLDGALAAAWEHGWTPADVVHVAGRKLSAAHARCAAELVVDDGRSRTRRGQELHPRWEEQLAVLAAEGGAPAGPARVRLAVELAGLLARLPAVPVTVPAPGGAPREAARAAGLDSRVLARVRGLLAKAESTDFEHEAEALTAKAQELIARHAIDEALLHSADDVGDPSVRRIPVDDPYADAKAVLLAEVAGANRCRAVSSPDLGWVTVFGYDHDLDAVELLAASLLAQATGAMARHGSRRDAAGRSTTRSFRRSFLFGFAHRIGDRLRAATEGQVAGASAAEQGRLLPVLSAREERLRAAEQAAFGTLVRRSGSVSNGAGWVAGLAAADLADLGVTAGALHER